MWAVRRDFDCKFSSLSRVKWRDIEEDQEAWKEIIATIERLRS